LANDPSHRRLNSCFKWLSMLLMVALARILPFLLLALWLGPAATAQELVSPAPLTTPQTGEEPYAYNGLVAAFSGGGYALGSGSLVSEGVYVTAAHVVWDEGVIDYWLPASAVRYHPQHHSALTSAPLGGHPGVALYKWDPYSARVLNDDSPPGQSSPDTFNIDFAAVTLGPNLPDSLTLHPEVNADPENAVSILRDPREKVIVGYPQADPVPPSERGLMHGTVPGNYYCWWEGIEETSERDSEGLWISIHHFENVVIHSGNSGGPIYARDDLGEWLVSGIAVGGSVEGDYSTIRAIDDEAWDWIEQANRARNQTALQRVNDLVVVTSPANSVTLQWTDRSEAEAGYTILRQSNGTYEVREDLPANSENYTDTAVFPGHVYHYRVQPYSANGNRAPKSHPAKATTSGANRPARDLINQPLFHLFTDGDSNWYDGGGRLRSGKVRSLGHSSLYLGIIGPGALSFDWSSSSEENPDYSDESSLNWGLIYDAVYLFLDGALVMEKGEPVFLSGIKGPVSRQVAIPEGAHNIEWRYEKDPYSDEFEDAAFLDSFTWTPGPTAPYPVYAGYAIEGTQRHGSVWFGDYDVRHWPWVEHHDLGWLYLMGGTGRDFYAYSELSGIGIIRVSLDLYPYLYRPLTDTWLYYIQGTGTYGQGIMFWDLQTDSLIQFP
jgi:hypothetical protein